MVSIIVPTYNRGRELGPTLESLLAQDADTPCEVVVVDNNSTDDTRETILEFAARSGGRIRYVFEADQGSSAARNAGIAAASGDIIAFVDDDVIAQPGWLQALVTAFRTHPDAWGVGGRVTLQLPECLPRWFNPAPGVMTTLLSLQDLGEGTFRFTEFRGLISANLAVTRAALERVGVFNTELGRFGRQLLCGEDIELCRRIYRAEGGLYYCGQAAVLHVVPDRRITRRFFRERAYWEGRTVGLVARLPKHFSLARWTISRALLILKDWTKLVILTGMGRPRRAFECELSARKQAGYLAQMMIRRAGRALA